MCLSLGLGLAACGGPDATSRNDWQVVHDTIGDTIVVRTVSGSIWGDTADLVPEVRIGVFEGPDEYMFGNIRSLAVAPDGCIYVYDSHARQLRKYAPDGTYTATFGGEGGGPGEYRQPDGGLAVLPDGRVVLRDPGNARLSVYSPEGDYRDSWRIPIPFNTDRKLYTDRAGNTYTLTLLDLDRTDWTYTFALLRYGPDGSPGDTLAVPHFDFERSQLIAQYIGESGNPVIAALENVPFTPTESWAYSPLGYFVGGVATRYALYLYKAPDRVLRIERVNWQPVPVLVDEREERERIVTAIMRQAKPDWRWNSDPIPDTKPPYRGLYVGARGRIWIRLHQQAENIAQKELKSQRPAPGEVPERTWIEPIAFDVFEPDGRYLGMVRAPSGFSRYPHPVFRGDTVWATVRDEFDVPYVVRFHIQHADGET
ncbi:MAG: hypothetical protein PVJ43_12875 [Gemmatimonadales bacterium]|jgi:hypothetical protein